MIEPNKNQELQKLIKDKAFNNHRFICELEFVQALSNPDYLNWLSKEKFFEEQEFLEFVEYLKYWKLPDYCHYVKYPQCFEILDYITDSEKFRQNIGTDEGLEIFKKQQSVSWIYADRNPEDFDF